MSDSDGRKTLGLGGSRPANVKQSFSHGRTKNVVVETKRKRVVVPKPGGQKPSGPGAGPVSDPSKRPAGITDAEMERRLKAVQAAKARDATRPGVSTRSEDPPRSPSPRLAHGIRSSCTSPCEGRRGWENKSGTDRKTQQACCPIIWREDPVSP